jgi:hypothetical protein
MSISSFAIATGSFWAFPLDEGTDANESLPPHIGRKLNSVNPNWASDCRQVRRANLRVAEELWVLAAQRLMVPCWILGMWLSISIPGLPRHRIQALNLLLFVLEASDASSSRTATAQSAIAGILALLDAMIDSSHVDPVLSAVERLRAAALRPEWSAISTIIDVAALFGEARVPHLKGQGVVDMTNYRNFSKKARQHPDDMFIAKAVLDTERHKAIRQKIIDGPDEDLIEWEHIIKLCWFVHHDDAINQTYATKLDALDARFNGKLHRMLRFDEEVGQVSGDESFNGPPIYARPNVGLRDDDVTQQEKVRAFFQSFTTTQVRIAPSRPSFYDGPYEIDPPRTCAACGKIQIDKSQVQLQKCSRCQKAYYCDRECMKSHWKKHKIVCNQAPPASLAIESADSA